ncbi:MAG: carbon storage regulator CsrA [Lentisphaeria bacterium]|nr:carbon storage regulator CsrA [Lentisphaeria bacterium]
MLILMRRCEESIMIGNNIEIKVLKIQGNQVHIGIQAPREITVYRHEIWQQLLDENRKALQQETKLTPENIGGFKKLLKRKKQ